MQVYRELRIVTARPTPEEERAVPHGALWGACGGRAGECGLVAGGGGRGDGGGMGGGTVPILCGGLDCISVR